MLGLAFWAWCGQRWLGHAYAHPGVSVVGVPVSVWGGGVAVVCRGAAPICDRACARDRAKRFGRELFERTREKRGGAGRTRRLGWANTLGALFGRRRRNVGGRRHCSAAAVAVVAAVAIVARRSIKPEELHHNGARRGAQDISETLDASRAAAAAKAFPADGDDVVPLAQVMRRGLRGRVRRRGEVAAAAARRIEERQSERPGVEGEREGAPVHAGLRDEVGAGGHLYIKIIKLKSVLCIYTV